MQVNLQDLDTQQRDMLVQVKEDVQKMERQRQQLVELFHKVSIRGVLNAFSLIQLTFLSMSQFSRSVCLRRYGCSLMVGEHSRRVTPDSFSVDLLLIVFNSRCSVNSACSLTFVNI